MEDILAIMDQVDGAPSIACVRGLAYFPGEVRQRRFELKPNPAHHAQWLACQPMFDSAVLLRRSALAQHRFPEFPGERFMAESWLWHALGRDALTLFINDVWTVCDYQPGGLSSRSRMNRATSPRGAMAVYEEIMKSPIPVKLRCRMAINWWCYFFHASLKRDAVPETNVGVLWALPGACLYLWDLACRRHR